MMFYVSSRAWDKKNTPMVYDGVCGLSTGASYIHVILRFTICTRALYYCDQLCRKGLPKYT